jgi:hypothetical protein
VAEERLQRRAYREYAILFTSIVLAGTSIYLGPLALVVSPLSLLGIAFYFLRLKRRSAMAILASRRKRLSKELGTDVQIGGRSRGILTEPHPMGPDIADATFDESVEPDPETLDIKELLKWMGARIES